MKRTTAAVLLAGLLLTTTAACGRDTGPLETRYEVTGTAGTKVTPTVHFVNEEGKAATTVLDPGVVPYSQTLVPDRGDTSMEAGPAEGALTCHIVVEGKEVAKVTGAPGQKVTCAGKVDE